MVLTLEGKFEGREKQDGIGGGSDMESVEEVI